MSTRGTRNSEGIKGDIDYYYMITNQGCIKFHSPGRTIYFLLEILRKHNFRNQFGKGLTIKEIINFIDWSKIDTEKVLSQNGYCRKCKIMCDCIYEYKEKLIEKLRWYDMIKKAIYILIEKMYKEGLITVVLYD